MNNIIPFRTNPYVNYRTPGGSAYTPFLEMAARPHLLVAGATGSGKSVVINGIITSLLIDRTPSECQFVLIDPKRVELSCYAKLPHTVRYASESKDMIDALQWITEEMERRYKVMQEQGVKEYAGPDMYVIVDEVADLMTTHKKAVLPLLQRIAQLARASRIHSLIATQCALASIIPTVLRCNYDTTVALRTATPAQSRYLINTTGCEMLPDPKRTGKGYAWIRDGADLHKEFIYKYPDEVINSLINWWMSSACIAV